MHILVHLIWTLVPSLLMNLDPFNFFLALVFGVLIDLDHIIPLIPYAIKNKTLFYTNKYIKTPVQEIIFSPVIILICVFAKTWVPLVFFLIHIILDYLFASINRPFSPFSKFEIKAPFNLRTPFYWIFTAFSIIFFVIFLFFNNNYQRLLFLITHLQQ
jgi:hypothetical protein